MITLLRRGIGVAVVGFAVRLNLWYASIFIVSTAILFLFVYLFLATAVQRKDRELIESRLKEYAAIYESGGVGALRNWIARSGDARTQRSFFVRVTGPFRNVLFLTAPEDWIEFEPRFEFGVPWQVAWVRVPKDQERDFTIAAMRLRDGSILQVGRSTNSREMILDPFDPQVRAGAIENGIDERSLEACERSPVYQYVKKWKLALPLHSEFRTVPMLFYVPPLLPVMANTDDGTYNAANEELFSPIEKARLPMEYLAKLFSAGNVEPVRLALKKQYAVRLFKRLETVGDRGLS